MGLTKLQKIIWATAIAAVLTGVMIIAAACDWFLAWEHKTYDFRFGLRGPLEVTVESQPITIVGLDLETTKRMKRNLKDLRRADYARVVRNLAKRGADLIAFDLTLSRPSRFGPEDDREFARAIDEAENVILARMIGAGSVDAPLNEFQDVAIGEGIINWYQDSDWVIRSMMVARYAQPLSENRKELYEFYSFPMELARLMMTEEEEALISYRDPDAIKFGRFNIPYRNNKALINYAGPGGSFPHISFSDVYFDEISDEDVKGRIMLIGSTHAVEHDMFLSPFHFKRLGQRTDKFTEMGLEVVRHIETYGVEHHANALHTILKGNWIRFSPRWLEPVSIVLIGAIALFGFFWPERKSWAGVVIYLVALSSLTWLAWAMFKARYWFQWTDAAVSLTAMFVVGIAFNWTLDQMAKKRISGIFGRYVSREVADYLIANPAQAKLGGQRAFLTIMESDIRSFSTMSQDMQPEEITDLLGEYFGHMNDILFGNKGTMDKYIGDAVLAFFGNPREVKDHPFYCVKTALEMRERMVELRKKWASEGKKQFKIGIGINTGWVVVGNLGRSDFVDYTVMGHTVNVTARLCDEARGELDEIWIGEDTYQYVKDRIEAEPLGGIKVKGIDKPVEVYRALRLKEGAVPDDAGGVGIDGDDSKRS